MTEETKAKLLDDLQTAQIHCDRAYDRVDPAAIARSINLARKSIADAIATVAVAIVER